MSRRWVAIAVAACLGLLAAGCEVKVPADDAFSSEQDTGPQEEEDAGPTDTTPEGPDVKAA